MWSKERHQRILGMLKSNQSVAANDLADLLDVSRETVRRDLLELEEKGLIERVHGGAVLPDQQSEPPFNIRRDAQARAKQDIARKAVSLIEPGMSLFIDAGTTTSAFSQILSKISGIMVVTNSIEISQTIKTSEADIDFILIGGRLSSDVPATYGEVAISDIRRFHLDMAIVSPVALHPDKGAFSYDFSEAEVARTMIEQAQANVFLCDRTKLSKTNRVRICDAETIDILVTDKKAENSETKLFEERRIQVLI